MRNTRRSRKTGESGIALLLTVFALLLLSAIALSMIYAANIETGVSANFRDKELSSYAAASGLQIARDLLRPSGYLDPDASAGVLQAAGALQGLPLAGSSKNVVYIINPAGSETVAPWQAGSKYADPELCHGNVLGLTGTTGVPCDGSSWPTGTWYHSINASATPFANFLPANFKWVRIQMKTYNSTPVTVDAANATALTQICWDGTNQFRAPLGSPDASCRTTDSKGVSGVLVTAPGAGYTVAPDVGFSGGGGSGATAHAVMKSISDGQVASVSMLTNGTGYTSQPTVTITGDGTGATATANIGGASVQSITPINPGTGCYTTPPAVTIAGGGGTGATATAHLATATDCVMTFLSSGSCKAMASSSGNVTVPVTLTGGSGSGAAGTITWRKNNGAYVSAMVTISGTGYTTAPTGFSGLDASCAADKPTGVILGHRVDRIDVTAGGRGYGTQPSVTFANGGSGTANLSGGGANAGKVTSIVVTNNGSGYTNATVTITGGGGTGATAQANIGATLAVDQVIVDSPGSGYTTAPTVTFSPNLPWPNGTKGKATIGGGPVPGRVFLITAMGYVPRANGAATRTLMQMEAANPPQTFNFNYLTGALTIDGPNPNLQNIPNSTNFKILGNDGNSCGETAMDPHPAVGVYDNAAVTGVTTQLSTNGAKPGNYTGVVGHPNPDVENVYNSLGEAGTTVSGMESLADSICSYAATLGTVYGNNAAAGEKPINTFLPASTNINSITCIDGNLTIPGSSHGYGVLLVRGDVILSGDYSWSGPIFVIGSGSYNANGGGNGQITGALMVAKTRDASGNLLTDLGSPIVNFEGGGGNGIQYDHCWADNLLAKIPIYAARRSRPLQVLSVRTVSY